MKTTRIWLDALVVGERQRTLKPERIDALAESMKTLGLQQPISVWFDADDRMHLIAGLHRVRAAEKLGWEQIDAVEVDLSPTEREMWEIAENLHRIGLTKEERDAHIRRYAELMERREAENKVVQNEPLSAVTGRGHKGTAQKIADETGLSKSTVRRAITPKPQPIDDGLKREAEHRAEQAKLDRERARMELCDFLLDALSPQQWDRLIALMDAHGKLTSNDLRNWQSPSEAA